MENNDNNNKNTSKPPNKGNGDPVQRAARDERLRKKLRENLKRRKQKARALKVDNDN